MKEESLLQKIWHFVFGYHYYAVISNPIGTFEANIMLAILPTRREAQKLLEGNTSNKQIEIISFWSRNIYEHKWDGVRNTNFIR